MTRIDEEVKILVSCYPKNYYLQKHTTYQFTYYILLISTEIQKKMMKIQQVHPTLQAKQFLLLYLNCFLYVVHLNLKRLMKRD